MAQILESNVPELEECIFCGSTYFYFEAPLDLAFLGRASICYICEARYKGIGIDNPDEKYNESSARRAKKSRFALHWKERATQYDGRVSS